MPYMSHRVSSSANANFVAIPTDVPQVAPVMSKETRAENVKIRVQPSVKFAIDFAARVTHRSLTQLVIDAVLPVLEDAKLRGKGWRDFDDPTPGYSMCLLYLHGAPLDKDEDTLKRFVLAHKEFFFDGDEPARRRLDVLWPRVEHFADTYFRKLKTDSFAAGHEMNKALTEAKRKPIVWPPEGE